MFFGCCDSSIRLKIKRGDMNLAYHPVGGSTRVYKAELNGEVRAAKVREASNYTAVELYLFYQKPGYKVAEYTRKHPGFSPLAFFFW